MSDEHGELFHHDNAAMEKRYQGKSDYNSTIEIQNYNLQPEEKIMKNLIFWSFKTSLLNQFILIDLYNRLFRAFTIANRLILINIYGFIYVLCFGTLIT